MKNWTLGSVMAALGAVAAAVPTMADAHHAMGNVTPGNAFEGFVSGLAHPVIGVDHLLFVIAIGVAAYYLGRRNVTAVTFVTATIAGTIVHLYQATWAYPDLWVALSLGVLGILFFGARRFLRSKAVLAFFALSGIAHGYAYGESIVGAEPTPLFAYLAGFAIVQFAIVIGACELTRVVGRRALASRIAPALGTVLLLAGAGFLFLSLA
jgi:urease accessory protein